MRDPAIQRLVDSIPPFYRGPRRCECCGVVAIGVRAIQQTILVLRPIGSVVVTMRTCLSEYCKGTAPKRAGERVDQQLMALAALNQSVEVST